MVLEDTLENKSSLVTVYGIQTLDWTAPTLVAEQVLPTSDNKIDLLVRANESGKVYMIALPVGSTAPISAAQVKALATGNTIATNLKATKAIAKDTDTTISITALTESKHFDIYLVCEDASLNMTATYVKFEAETSKLNLNNVVVDLANSILTNTTVGMEYSYDGMTWNPCSKQVATETTIIYDDAAQNLNIFIHEIADKSNMRIISFGAGNAGDIDTNKIDYDIAAGKIMNNSAINLQYGIEKNDGTITWKLLNASSTVSNVIFNQGELMVRTAATSPTITEDSLLPSAAKVVVNIPEPNPNPELAYDNITNTISHLDNTYEYSIDGGSWVNGLVVGDFTGTKKVLVRTMATKLFLPSVAQVINFTAGTIKVVASPASGTQTKNTVRITFEESTNQKTITIADFKNWFKIGKNWDESNKVFTNPDDWGDILQPTWKAANVLTVEYNSTTVPKIIGEDVKIFVGTGVGITNTTGSSGNYSSEGILTGSFHTVPVIQSIKAINTNNDQAFSNEEQLVITFDQDTNQDKNPIQISGANIGDYLVLTDSTGISGKNWNTDPVNPLNLSVDWDSDKVLRITFKDVTKTDLEVGFKITVSPLWGLKDLDNTTAVCKSSAIIGGSFKSSPEIKSVVIANNGGTATKEVGDTITIGFKYATNSNPITATMLINSFKLMASDGKTAHSWGAQKNTDITWSADGMFLTIKLSSITNVTLANGDKLTILAGAGIKEKDGGTDPCVGSFEISGTY